MRVWRICRKEFAKDPLGGRGGLFVSGRWHTRGQRVVYCAGSLALAALELLVHAEDDALPTDLVRLEIELPNALKRHVIRVKSLPKNWRSYPAPAALQRRGDDWLETATTAVLEVPSAVIPEESNFVLNPQHSGAGRIKVISTRPFKFDGRLVP